MDHEIELTERIIGCAIEVHRVLGPGLLESTYKKALCIELGHAQLQYQHERKFHLNIAVPTSAITTSI